MNMASFEAFSFSNYSSDDKGIKTSGLGDILNVIQSNNFLTYLYLTQAGVVSADKALFANGGSANIILLMAEHVFYRGLEQEGHDWTRASPNEGEALVSVNIDTSHLVDH